MRGVRGARVKGACESEGARAGEGWGAEVRRPPGLERPGAGTWVRARRRGRAMRATNRAAAARLLTWQGRACLVPPTEAETAAPN